MQPSHTHDDDEEAYEYGNQHNIPSEKSPDSSHVGVKNKTTVTNKSKNGDGDMSEKSPGSVAGRTQNESKKLHIKPDKGANSSLPWVCMYVLFVWVWMGEDINMSMYTYIYTHP